MRLSGFYYVWMDEVKMAKNGKLLQKLLQGKMERQHFLLLHGVNSNDTMDTEHMFFERVV